MNEYPNMHGMAAIKPNAVVFIACEIPADSKVAFIDASAFATASNELIKPKIVPNNPNNVATFAIVER